MNNKPDKVQEIHLFDYVVILVRRRWMIIRNVILTTVLVVLISFFLPQKYIAVATLMPPEKQSKSALEGVLSDMTVPGISLNTPASSSEIMVEILKSRSVGERVLQKRFTLESDSLPLFQLLKFPSLDIGLIRMRKKARFTVSQQGIITVAVTLGNRKLAADVANAYVQALDAVNQEKSVSRAKNSRIYIESQLKETEKKLKEVTQKLADFQQKHKAISLEEQMNAAIQQAGELKGQIIAKEVQLGVMLQTMKAMNPEVIRAQMELDQLRRRYQEFQFGKTTKKGEVKDFYVPFADVPEIGLKLAELTRQAKVQETVWQLLNQQYYQAKIQEAQDTPTVQVLDRAVPPVFRSSPNRKMLVIVFALLSFFVSILWAFVQEYLVCLDNRPEEKDRLQQITLEFRNDLRRIKKNWGK
ncbi:MAG: hypothetical protein GWP06_16950 [Actinobacteria bacterium]|nr:hypothetical protein [Actinomycetota bacterium]